jgi:choline dehydrogenase-like flavoprotein
MPSRYGRWLHTVGRYLMDHPIKHLGKSLSVRMHELYGVGVDWPISYRDIEPWYVDAEYEMGHGCGGPIRSLQQGAQGGSECQGYF